MELGSSLRLEVKGIGHCPSFKNGKRLFLTSRKNAQWMRQCIASFESQLLSACPIIGGVILTVDLRQFLTASLPQDDNWKCVPEIHLRCERVPKGEEGAIILIDAIK